MQKTRSTRSPAATRTPSRGAGRPADVTEQDRAADLQAFFDAFARFLTSGEADRISQMWEYPALVVGDNMLASLIDTAAVENFFAGSKDQYNERGIIDTRPDIQSAEWVTDRIVIAKIRWPYLNEDDDEVGEETSTYTLRRGDDNELRMCVAVMHGGTED